uniref:solute carrier family 2, facilitated glucose transporter member 11-like isoform X4 n=1 Tax=Pristiophorus japonicus TaxID=55135 RepID=UPI00398E7D0B
MGWKYGGLKREMLQSRGLLLTIFAASIGGTFQYGFNLTIINAPTTYIQKFINETWTKHYGTQLESGVITLLWSITVATYFVGGLVGALIAGPMAITCGRRNSLLLSNIFVLVGALLMGLSRTAESFEMIIIGRFFSGINSGVGININPMYLGECAPKKIRGLVALSFAPFTAAGLVVGQTIGLREILGSEELWPLLLASCAVPALIQLITLPWCPESPRYLLIDRENKDLCIKGIPNEKIQYATIGTGCSEFITALTSNLFVERIGRRMLLLGGYSSMVVCGILFTISLTLQDKITWMPFLSMACIFASILSFGIGPAGVTGIIPMEIFDQTARPAAYMINGSLFWITLIIVGMTFPFIVGGLGSFCYVPFLSFSFLAALFIGFFLPETKGKTFLEISHEFYERNFKGQPEQAETRL